MPHATIWTAPAGSGKTGQVIQTILQAREANRWQPIWVLLPTELQVSAFRDRLLTAYQSKFGRPACFGVQFFSFYKLYDHLLDQMLLPQKQIGQASVYRILRYIVTEQAAQNRLLYFGNIATKPGFIKLMAQFILELKQARIHPESFELYAQKSRQAKDQDLAAIYTHFQNYLRDHQLVDREGAGWVVLRGLETRYNTGFLDDVGLLVVDGFINFSPLQARLLGELAARIARTILTLSYDENRRETLYLGIHRIGERLQNYGQWEVKNLTGGVVQRRHELAYLETAWQQPTREPQPAKDALHLIEAPSPEQEVRAVLRKVKQQLVAGVNPEQIAILAYSTQAYADFVRSIAESYRVPVVVRRGIELTRNPAVATILQLLDLHSPPVNFRQQALLDVLRTPYFIFHQLMADDADELERVSQQFQVVQSRHDWLEAIQMAGSRFEDEDGEERVTDVDPALYQRLQAFFERVTPLPEATPREYVAWIENLLGPDPVYLRERRADVDPTLVNYEGGEGHLGFYGQVREPLEAIGSGYTGEAVTVRDIHAMQAFRACLSEILRAFDLLAEQTMGGVEALMPWEDFRKDLQQSLESHPVEPVGGTYRSGRVLFTDVFEASGLTHDHIYIMGLAEGVFPSQNLEDPLYSDAERRLAQSEPTYFELQTTMEQVDDVLVFYQTCAMARETLTLSRPTLDEKANPWPPSILWRETTSILTDAPITRLRGGDAPELAEAGDMREAGIALAAAISQAKLTTTEARSILAALLADGPRWQNILRGRSIEAHRENLNLPFDRYSGVVREPALVARVAAQLGSNRKWSASQFNDYGYCPFRFFAKRVLQLEELKAPEEGYDAAQLGSVQHEVLENTYLRILNEGLAIQPENAGRAVEILVEEAARWLPSAPQRWGFRPTPLWEQEKDEIVRRLGLLIGLDFSDNPKSPFVATARSKGVISDLVSSVESERRVFALEKAFGMDGGLEAVVSGEAGPLWVRGKIDRIDRVGDMLIIMDYKSGSKTPKNEDIEDGRNFQMLLYLLAARQIIAQEYPELEVKAGMFWSIRTRKADGQIWADAPLLEEARQRLHEYIVAGRQGRFEVQPTKYDHGKCFTYCEFHQFCRVHRGSGLKGGVE
ncbi:MAG: PD-(D/E)XK nuclease family protein [Chloroflexi bacterium]|nr:PD-(D/E)XK nuclease family protein [Chloroflexota bacterium]